MMAQAALFEAEPEDDREARERLRGPRVRQPGYTLGRCRYGCEDRTVWVRLVNALGEPKRNRQGRQSMMLVNLGAMPDGNVMLLGAGRARVVSPREYRDPTAELYEPHAATCRKTRSAAA